MKTGEEERVPTFLELPYELQKLLVKEFVLYIIHQIRFRHYIIFVSICALSYQSRNLVATYLLFQTVVKVEINKPYTVDLPGVSLCADKHHIIMKSKLREKYPEITEKISQFDENTQKDEIMNVYRHYKQIAYENLTLGEWFNLTLDPKLFFECKMILKPNYHSNQSLPHPNCYEFGEPYYNIPYGAGLCWTYFSQIHPVNYTPTDARFEYYLVDIPEETKLISFKIDFNIYDDVVYDDAPPTAENPDNSPEIYVVVDNPKHLTPSISLDRAIVRAGTNFDIYFTQTIAKLLRWPFKTNCVWYEKEGKFKKYKSSDQCIDDCLSNLAVKECGCVFNESRGGRITKWANPDQDYPFCKEYDLNETDVYPDEGKKPRRCAHRKNYDSHFTHCSTIGVCNSNCVEIYYKYEVKELFFDENDDNRNRSDDEDEFRTGLPLYGKSMANESWATVNIIRKDAADVTYEHTAEMVFVEFVCYFGGLLGLWLGVSILDMYHQCLIWWDEMPIEYKKWLERQHYLTKVEKFSVNQANISVISSNYTTEKDYNAPITNVYDTKY